MKRLGKQEPRYTFFLNPYPDMRFTRCPKCERKTKLRKLPLVINVDPLNLFVLNKTCRYCPYSDLLIAHQDEIEELLAAFFAEKKPEVVGNDYLVLGTLDRPDWQKGVETPVAVQDIVEQLHDFKDVVKFELTGGWMPDQSTTSPSGAARPGSSRGHA